MSDQIAHYADSVLALQRTKNVDGEWRTVLLTLKRRNLGRTEEDGSSELAWTGTRYADPKPAEFFQRLFDEYAGR